MRRGGGRTPHYGAGSGVVGPREVDSEGEAKDHKRQAQHGGVEVPHTGPKPLLPYSTKTRTPRPLPKQPDIQTETTEGKPSEPLITPRVGGPEGRAAAGEHQKNPGQTTGPDTEANQQRGGKGKPAQPRGDQTHKRRNNDKQKTTETNHRSKRKMPRDQTKGEPPRETVPRYNKHEFRMEEGPDDFPQRETRH